MARLRKAWQLYQRQFELGSEHGNRAPRRQGRDRHRRRIGHRPRRRRAVPARRRGGRRLRHHCRRTASSRPTPAREADVKRAVDHAVAQHGGLDIFFANAGISGGLASIFEQTAEDWAEILRVDLIGPFLAIKHAAPALKARGGGSIICTASVAGLRSGAGGRGLFGGQGRASSTSSTTAAQQLAGTNIRVNAICPGLIETGMTEVIYQTAREKGVGDRIGELESLAARRRARSRSPRPRCSSPPTNPPTSTARRWSSTAACRAACRPPAASTSARMRTAC